MHSRREPKAIETWQASISTLIWGQLKYESIAIDIMDVCQVQQARLSSIGLVMERGRVRGNTFESICGWSGRVQWRFMCALLCSIWNNLDGTIFNQREKMKREKKRRTERTKNGKLKTKIENEKRFKINFCCCATDDSRGESSRVGREMNDDLYVFYLGCFQLLTEELAMEGEE